ncbi:MAG: DUF58 domain-containing protein [Candidatus Delongbacteria bacterium]
MLTSELLERIRRLEIRTRRRVQTLLAGEYHSAFKGQGMDFAEVREYVPGDEVRSLDWNVSARMGAPFVKVFQEERELNVLLAVDVSASGRFGSAGKSKRDWMAELGAVLAFSAIRNRDKVGLLLFSDRVERHVPPAKGSRHGLRLIRDLLAHEPEGRGTDLGLALQHLQRTQKKRAIIFLISDFQAPLDARGLRALGRRHDLVALCVQDRLEGELPPLGLLRLEDLETGRRRWLDAGDPAVRAHWRARWQERRQTLDQTLRAAAVDQVRLSAGEDPGRPLEQFFLRRSQRT